MQTRVPVLAAAVLCVVGLAAVAQAQAIRNNAGFNTNTLPGNDDGSTGLVGIGFSANFFGAVSSNLYVNNNGNVTFTAPLGIFTPFSLTNTSTRIIAPFFADVDTRPVVIRDVTYGTDTVGGRAAFGVNWFDVGFFANQTNPTNNFQLVMIDRSDTGAGNFDFEFNYSRIRWETGQASGGSPAGLGGSSARAGFSNGLSGAAERSFELAGSAINGALLDAGPNALIAGHLNSQLSEGSGGNVVRGRYLFTVRNGQVQVVPLPPAALAGLGTLAAACGITALRRRRAAR